MHARGEDVSWFMNVLANKQDPWVRMLDEFDPNKQMAKFN
jgi:hypothetical protein